MADGYSLAPYHYVHPPPWLRLTNKYPAATVQTVPLNVGPNYYATVATSDAQLSIAFRGPAQTLGHPRGQTSIRIGIHPLRKFTIPSTGGLVLDGNVYGLHFRFLPSRRTATRARGNVLITLYAPHNMLTNRIEGRFGRQWSIMCRSPFIDIQGLPACLTRRLPNQIAVFFVKAQKHSSPGPSPFIIAAIVIVIMWVGLILFLFASGRLPGLRRQ